MFYTYKITLLIAVKWYTECNILDKWPNAENALHPFPPGSNTKRTASPTPPRPPKPDMVFFEQDNEA